MPALGLGLPSASVRRLWTMLAHYHGQTWNGSELGNSLGISHHPARSHLDLLVGTYMVRTLAPFFISTFSLTASHFPLTESGTRTVRPVPPTCGWGRSPWGAAPSTGG